MTDVTDKVVRIADIVDVDQATLIDLGAWIASNVDGASASECVEYCMDAEWLGEYAFAKFADHCGVVLMPHDGTLCAWMVTTDTPEGWDWQCEVDDDTMLTHGFNTTVPTGTLDDIIAALV